jgi:hypothetical protein
MEIINNLAMRIFDNRNVTAWVLMISAVALHVIDEAAHDFLPFYNQLILDLRNQTGFFPAPTFSFGTWIGGLASAVIIGFSVTPIVRRGGKVIRVVTTALGILMIANALGHIIGSIYFGRLIPGFWSSPILFPAAAYVALRGFKDEWAR